MLGVGAGGMDGMGSVTCPAGWSKGPGRAQHGGGDNVGLTSYTWKKRVEVSIGGEKQNKARLNHTSSSELLSAGKGPPGQGVQALALPEAAWAEGRHKGKNKGEHVQGEGWKTPRRAAEVLANMSRQIHGGYTFLTSAPPGGWGGPIPRCQERPRALPHQVDPNQTLPAAPQASVFLPAACPTHPALLLLLLGVGVLAAADAGVAGDAVEAGDAVRGVLPLDAQLWAEAGEEVSAACTHTSARATSPLLHAPLPSSHPNTFCLSEPPCQTRWGWHQADTATGRGI